MIEESGQFVCGHIHIFRHPIGLYVRGSREEGLHEGLMTAAAGMKKMGMETSAIIQATGLSEAVIRNL